jgi:hypothetical protein
MHSRTALAQPAAGCWIADLQQRLLARVFVAQAILLRNVPHIVALHSSEILTTQ